MGTSINTNIAAYFAQANITAASNAAQSSVARLSSGNAIVNASDNVAALATGTSLATQVSALKTAQTNASQGSSLLQVADGALAQIQSILQQQQALSLQAASGSLTNTDRGFLNQQFSALTNEINSLAKGTTFNGVGLIDGSISGGTTVDTNTTAGSTTLPASATIATFGGNAVSGDTYTIKVAGQAAQTFTFGGTSGIGVGATASDSAANLASALNNSGLSQLSDFRFQASGTTVSAYYTGKATGINNIPKLTTSTTSSTFTATALPTFTAATQIGAIAGLVNANDTITVGSHQIKLVANGTDALGFSTTTTPPQADIGLSTSTDGVTGTALDNLVSLLNTVAGTQGYSDLQGITFSTDATGPKTHLYAAYSGVGAAQPTLSTTYVSSTPINYGGGTSQTLNASSAVITSTATNFNAGSTVTIGGGSAITFTNGTPTAGQVQIGGTLTLTLANLATFLNTAANQATYVGAAFKVGGTTAIFSSDSTHLFANNTDKTGAAYTPVSTTFGNTIVSSTAAASVGATDFATLGDANGASAYQNGGTAIVTGSGAQLTTTGGSITIGAAVFHINAGGGTSGLNIDNTVSTTDTLVVAAIAAYLNTAAGQAAGGSGNNDISGLVFKSAGGVLTAYNTTDTAKTAGAGATGGPTVTQAGGLTGTLATQQVIAAQKGAVLSVQNAGAGNTILEGTSLKVGTSLANGTTIQFIATGATAGAHQVNIGATDAVTLANLETYLNSTAGQADVGGTLSGQFFTFNGTDTIYVGNTSGAQLTGATAPLINLNTANVTPTTSTVLTGATLSTASVAGSFSGSTAAISPGSVLTVGIPANVAGAQFAAGSTVNINGAGAITLIAAGATAVGNQVNVGSNNFATLQNLVTFLNGATGQTYLSGNVLGETGIAFSTDGTHLIATNGTAGVLATGTSGVSAYGVTTPQGAVAHAAITTITNGAANALNVLTLGIDTLVFGTTAQVTAGAANVDAGANLSASLDNAVTFLNTIAPPTTTAVFSHNGSGQLLAQSTNGLASLISSAFTSTSPSFTGVTGQIITATSAVGLGAGTTSAQGTPTGSLFVSSAGTSATDFGNPVDLSNVANNDSFVGAFGGTGTIGAITGTYVNTGVTGTSGVQFSVTVGNDTYTTDTITNDSLTSATAPVPLTFTGSNTVTSAAEGGSFTLTLQPQSNITSQNQASQLATGINAALASVSVYQNRNVLSYNNNYSAQVSGQQTATLAGSSLAFNSNNFINPSISNVTVSSPSTGSTDAKITAVVNGDTYTTGSAIGDSFTGSNEIVLINQSNPNQTLTLTLGASGSADLSNASSAAAFQTALSNALGLNKATGGLVFQLGSTAVANVSVTIGSAQTSALFGGQALDISTQNGATSASAVVATAIDTVTSLRAGVGALESQFNFASAALQTSVQNQDAARGALLDTDIAAESTSFATSQVKLQAGISVLAQANQQLQALLKLIG